MLQSYMRNLCTQLFDRDNLLPQLIGKTRKRSLKMRGRGRSMETLEFQDEIWTPKKEGTDV